MKIGNNFNLVVFICHVNENGLSGNHSLNISPRGRAVRKSVNASLGLKVNALAKY